MWSYIFLATCVIFALIICIVFNSKQHIKNRDTKIFSKISIITIITSAFELLLQISITLNDKSIVSVIFSKLYLVLIIIWFCIFSRYVCYLLIEKIEKYQKIIDSGHKILSILLSIMFMLLPIIIVHENGTMYSSGPGVIALKVVLAIFMMCWLILSALHYEKIFKKSYIPIIGVYLLLITNIILQSINPELTIVSLTLTVVVYLMYFTIENPDLKMVNELYKNKSIMEQSYVDKSNFMFEMTQELKDPLNNIKNEYHALKKSNNIKEYQAFVEKIGTYSRQLEYIVNDVLNVNTLDVQQIKFIDNKYNFNLIFDQVIAQVKDSINPKVKFDAECTKGIPELYGDSIKIKQLMLALLQNSIQHTTNGSISIHVDTIERFDALRLIIQIKDSSGGIPIDIVNDILSTTAALDKKDIELLERNEISMKLCQKVVKLMGGNLMIKNTERKGTEIILTIDQRIETKSASLGLYEEYVATDKKVAIVCQNKKLNDFLRKFFNTNDIKNTIILNGNYLLDDIKSGKRFDYILVANDMKEINGYTILKTLKENPEFNTPVVLMLESDSMKEKFLEEGFSDVVLLDNIEEDIAEIIKKY